MSGSDAALDFPPVGELVAHTGPMCLLDRVVEHADDHTVCAVDPAGSRLFREPDGSVPALLGVEYMAQCIAVHAGLEARSRGEAVRPGLFLGSRRIVLRSERFEAGRVLHVRARFHRGRGKLVAFDCRVSGAGDGTPLVEGRLNAYVLDGFEELREAERAGRALGGSEA